MKPAFFSIIALGICAMAFSQRLQFDYYTEKDGLSNNNVSCFLMDRQGFLWVGTSFGLNRFDGNAFERFFHNPNDTNSLADNSVQKVFVDRKNRLWIGTNAGISQYIPARRSFANYSPDTTVLPVQGISFGALCDDADGNIWVGTKNDLLVFNPSNHTFSSSGWAKFAPGVVPANGNHFRVIVLGLIQKSIGELWALTTYGLFSVNTATKQFGYYPCPKMTDYNGYQLNYADSTGNVWISTYHKGLLCFNSNSETWTSYRVPQKFSALNNTCSAVQYAADTLVYCADNSAILFGTKKKTLTRIGYDSGESYPFKNAICNTINRFNDLLWMGTDQGMVKIAPLNNPFRFVGLAGKGNIGRVYRFSNHDALLFSTENKTYSTFIKWNGKAATPLSTPDGSTLHSNYQFFAEAKDGTFYLNDDEHLYRYNITGNKAINIPTPPKAYAEYPFDIRNMAIDKNGDVWIRTLSQGMMHYNVAANKLTLVANLPFERYKELSAFYYDACTHSLWISEEFNGIYIYDIATKQTLHYGLNEHGSQRKAAIVAITGDNHGNIWMTDLNAGLIEYDRATKRFVRFTAYDGLPSNNCGWLLFDGKGRLWVNTDLGLSRYDPSAHTFTNYLATDGFPTSPGVYLSRDKAGNIYMPYKNGYYTWNGASVKDPVKTGRLYLRDVLLFDRHLIADSAYHFSYRENNIRLLFGLLSFDNRETVLLEYALNGNTWIATDLHAYVSFASLAQGSYDLKVRIKGERMANMHIHFLIEKPFWLRGWFVTLLALMVISGILLIVRNRVRIIRKEASLRQLVAASEMSALRSQMNPHFIFNTLNSINSYIIENKKDEASDYLIGFSKLVRIILEHSQKKTVTLQEELNALKLYLELESKRLEASFDYTIQISPHVDTGSISIPPLILQPFVENAIWHGLRGKKSAGHIYIKIKKLNSGLELTVEDNGIGRIASGKNPRAISSNSFGTSATMQRIMLNDSRSGVKIEDLYNNDKTPAGTRVVISLTLNEN